MTSGHVLTGRFPRGLRLKRRSLLRPLFRRGTSGTVAAGSIRLLYRVVGRGDVPGGAPVQVAFIPGKQPTAVVRNRVRRTLREVYRGHHARLVDLLSLDDAHALTIAVMLRAAVTPDLFAVVLRDLPRALDRLAAAVNPPPAEDPHNPGAAPA